MCLRLTRFSNCIEKNGILCDHLQLDHEDQLNTIVLIYQQRLGVDTVTNNPQILVGSNNKTFILAHVYCELRGRGGTLLITVTQGLVPTKLATISYQWLCQREELWRV